MKILSNLPAFAKLVYCLKYFNPYKKKIEAAKAAGDYEEERKNILAATSSWGPMIMDMFIRAMRTSPPISPRSASSSSAS